MEDQVALDIVAAPKKKLNLRRKITIQRNISAMTETISKKKYAQQRYYEAKEHTSPLLADSDEKPPVHDRLGKTARVGQRKRIKLRRTWNNNSDNFYVTRRRFISRHGLFTRKFGRLIDYSSRCPAQFRLDRLRNSLVIPQRMALRRKRLVVKSNQVVNEVVPKHSVHADVTPDIQKAMQMLANITKEHHQIPDLAIPLKLGTGIPLHVRFSGYP